MFLKALLPSFVLMLVAAYTNEVLTELISNKGDLELFLCVPIVLNFVLCENG